MTEKAEELTHKVLLSIPDSLHSRIMAVKKSARLHRTKTRMILDLIARALPQLEGRRKWTGLEVTVIDGSCEGCGGHLPVGAKAEYAILEAGLDGPYCAACAQKGIYPVVAAKRVPTRHGGFQNAKGVEEIEKWKATANEVWRGRQDDEQEIEDEEFEEDE